MVKSQRQKEEEQQKNRHSGLLMQLSLLVFIYVLTTVYLHSFAEVDIRSQRKAAAKSSRTIPPPPSATAATATAEAANLLRGSVTNHGGDGDGVIPFPASLKEDVEETPQDPPKQAVEEPPPQEAQTSQKQELKSKDSSTESMTVARTQPDVLEANNNNNDLTPESQAIKVPDPIPVASIPMSAEAKKAEPTEQVPAVASILKSDSQASETTPENVPVAAATLKSLLEKQVVDPLKASKLPEEPEIPVASTILKSSEPVKVETQERVPVDSIPKSLEETKQADPINTYGEAMKRNEELQNKVEKQERVPVVAILKSLEATQQTDPLSPAEEMKKRNKELQEIVAGHQRNKELQEIVAGLPKGAEPLQQQEQQLGGPPKSLQCSDLDSLPAIPSQVVTNKCVWGHFFNQSVHASGDIVSQEIAKYGCWEKNIVTSIVRHFEHPKAAADDEPPNPSDKMDSEPSSKVLLKQQRTFIDIGGNIGAYSTTMAQLGYRVITVEPFQLNVPLLLQTLCNNNNNNNNGKTIDQVQLFKVALSDKSPGQKMCLWSTNSEINNGNARMTPYFEGTQNFGENVGKNCMEVIYSYTLDELLGLASTTQAQQQAQQEQPLLLTDRVWGMKMDIEGYEAKALRGASHLLSSRYAPCRIWFEFQSAVTIESGAKEYEIFEKLLHQFGYKELYVVEGAHFEKIPPTRYEVPDSMSFRNGDYMVVHGDPECSTTTSTSTPQMVSTTTTAATSSEVAHSVTISTTDISIAKAKQ